MSTFENIAEELKKLRQQQGWSQEVRGFQQEQVKYSLKSVEIHLKRTKHHIVHIAVQLPLLLSRCGVEQKIIGIVS